GAMVTDSAGDAIEIPAGAVSANTIFDLRPLAVSTTGVTLPNGFTVLGAVQLDLPATVLAQAASLSIPRPANLPNGTQVVIAQVISDPNGVRRLRLVAIGDVNVTRIGGQTTTGGLTLRGITTSGQYLFIQPPAPLGLITGMIFAPGSNT